MTDKQPPAQGFAQQGVMEVVEQGFELSTAVRVASEKDVKRFHKKDLKSLTSIRLPMIPGQDTGDLCEKKPIAYFGVRAQPIPPL